MSSRYAPPPIKTSRSPRGAVSVRTHERDGARQSVAEMDCVCDIGGVRNPFSSWPYDNGGVAMSSRPIHFRVPYARTSGFSQRLCRAQSRVHVKTMMKTVPGRMSTATARFVSSVKAFR